MKRRPYSTNKPDELPSDVEELKAMVIDLCGQVEYLKRMLFGRRSEKLGGDGNQGLLFGKPETQEDQEQEEVPEEDEETSARRRPTRHRGRRPLPDHLPRCTHEIHPPEEELTCPCCGERKRIFARDVTEELEVVPAKFSLQRKVVLSS